MQVCTERYLISKSYYPYPSKSDPTKKPYRAYAFRDDEPDVCTCYPFLTGRKKKALADGTSITQTEFTCSHLKRLHAKICDWIQETEDDYQWSQHCPKCGEELHNTDIIDIPEDRDGQIEDLRKLLRSLDEDSQDLDPATDEVDASTEANDLLNMMKGTSP